MIDPVVSQARAVNGTHVLALQCDASLSKMLGVAAIIAIDAVAFHLFFISRYPIIAWTLTTANVVILAFLWRDYRATSHPTLTLDAGGFTIAVGRYARCRVPWSHVAAVEPATWRSEPNSDAQQQYLNVSGPLTPNILVRLREPVPVRLPFGLRKRVTRIGLRLEDAESALQTLELTRSGSGSV